MSLALDVLEDWAAVQWDPPQVDARDLQQRQFRGAEGLGVDSEHATDTQPQAGGGERAIGRGPAEAPPSGMVRGDVTRGGTDDHQIRERRRGARVARDFPRSVDLAPDRTAEL